MALRIIFMGTPDFAVPTLEALVAAGHEVVCVLYPAAPSCREEGGSTSKQSPVAVAAERHGIEVRWPTSLKGTEEQAAFAALDADVAVVVAYGMLLPQAILDAPRYGCFNGHASLLPRWRGAAPIQRAIMAGDEETGICVMQMEAGLDTGPVALKRRVPITDETTAGQLHDRLSQVGAEAMVEAMMRLEAGAITLDPQPADGVTYARKIDKGETRIDWSQPARTVHRHIMGLSPFPGAWCEIDGRTGEGAGEPGSRIESGAPGTVLDGLTVACGDRCSDADRGCRKRAANRWTAATFLRGTAVEPGTLLA